MSINNSLDFSNLCFGCDFLIQKVHIYKVPGTLRKDFGYLNLEKYYKLTSNAFFFQKIQSFFIIIFEMKKKYYFNILLLIKFNNFDSKIFKLNGLKSVLKPLQIHL